jgi:UDP-N-acetylmuramyl pentapeptide phosphotransferase/UDP-N-acetylglucosamine-1-phosphate transferase
VQSLPLILSIVVAALVVPPLVRALREQGFVTTNYRGAPLPFPTGMAIPVAAMLALVPLALVQELGDVTVFRPGAYPAVTYVLGVALLGLIDDFVGSGIFSALRLERPGEEPQAPRGWRGHGREILGGGFSTGAAKAAGSLGLALFALSGQHQSTADYLVGVGVLVLATNLFNLLDLRPGRSAKALVLLGAALSLGAWDAGGLWTVGLFVGPILVLVPFDLRERGMLGDTGSNAIGAVAGLWLVATLSTTGQAIALAVMAVVTVYGEFRSISALIERTPGLRQLDSLGRIQHA